MRNWRATPDGLQRVCGSSSLLSAVREQRLGPRLKRDVLELQRIGNDRARQPHALSRSASRRRAARGRRRRAAPRAAARTGARAGAALARAAAIAASFGHAHLHARPLRAGFLALPEQQQRRSEEHCARPEVPRIDAFVICGLKSRSMTL